MFSLLFKFQKISPCSFRSRGRFTPILVLFLNISLKIWRPSLCKTNSKIYSFFHHDLYPYAMLRLISKFQNILPNRGPFIPIFGTFSKDFAQKYGGHHCAKTNSMAFFFFITTYLLKQCLSYYQKLKTFYRVGFLVDGALFPFWNIFLRFHSKIWRPSLCKN